MEKLSRRQFLKRTVAAAGAATTAGWWASGCAPSFNGRAAPPVLSFWAFSETRIAWQQRAWDLYKREKRPEFDLDFLVLPFNQMHDKLMIVSQAESRGPDIADIEISQFSRFIKGDVIFVDLTPELQRMGALEQMYRPSATDPWTWENRVYGVGNELNACLLSYRHDVWEKAGVRAPIETWEAFAEQAQRFHRDTGNYLLDMEYNSPTQWFELTLQQGGGFFDRNGQPALTSAEGVRTLEWQQRAVRDGWSTLRPPASTAYNAALGSGRIASLLGPSWNFSGFVQQNLPETEGLWRLQPFPRWTPDGSRTATAGGTGVTVLKTSPMIAEARDFVLWEHTNVEALLGDYEERQVWPTYQPAYEDPRLTEPIPFFDNQRVGDLIVEVAPTIPEWYNSPYWPETTDACVRVGLTPALQNDVPARRALAAAQAEANEVIAFQTA